MWPVNECSGNRKRKIAEFRGGGTKEIQEERRTKKGVETACMTVDGWRGVRMRWNNRGG